MSDEQFDPPLWAWIISAMLIFVSLFALIAIA
jgi:hypothetical protein